jgi:nitrogen regulatory protein PII-like uncharacterized protein
MKFLLVWIVANVSGVSLPQGQTFDTREQCETAAKVVTDLSKGGVAGVQAVVRAACIEIAPAPGSK